MEALKKFFRKKSNLIMTIVIAVLLIGGILGASVLRNKDFSMTETDALVQDQKEDSETEKETAEAETGSDAAEVSKENLSEKDTSKETESEDADSAGKIKTEENTEQKDPSDVTSDKETDSSKTNNTVSDSKTTPKADSSTTQKDDSTSKPSTSTTTTPAATPEPTATPTPTPEPTPEKKTCTISINCESVLGNMDKLTPGKEGCVPANGSILSTTTMEFDEGETVLDVLVRACSNAGIQLEYSYTPAYGSYYIEGINNLYEFDCGKSSGWKYLVNGIYPNYGCSGYALSNGDKIVWTYTCSG